MVEAADVEQHGAVAEVVGREVSAICVRFPLESTADGKAALATLDDAEVDAVISRLGPDVADGLHREVVEIRRTGIAFDRDEHTPGISAAAIARRAAGDNVIAISVPAPTERFLQKEGRIVDALRAVIREPNFSELLDLAVAQPRRYGAEDPLVLARLFTLLREVAWRARQPDHESAIVDQLSRLRRTTAEQNCDKMESDGLAALGHQAEAVLAGQWRPPVGEPC